MFYGCVMIIYLYVMIIFLCYDMNLCVMIIYGSHLLFLSYFCCYFLENRINRKIWRLLCRAYAHGKADQMFFAVCIRTAKEALDFPVNSVF